MNWFEKCPACSSVAEPRRRCDCGYTTDKVIPVARTEPSPVDSSGAPPSRRPPVDPAVSAYLGPVILYCHPRPLIEYLLAEGARLPRLFMSAFGMGLLGSCLLTAPWALILPRSLPFWVIQLVSFVWFIACCLGFFWLFVLRFYGDYLVLHEEGFRYRVNYFSKGVVRFEDLCEINLGSKRSELEAMGYELSKAIGRPWPAAYESARRNRVLLGFKTSQSKVIGGFQSRFDSTEFAQFLKFIADRFPGLLSTCED